MHFTHPQLKLNGKNLGKILLSFLKKPDLESLKKRLSFYFPQKQLLFTDMGRSAFRLIIEKLNLENSQMLMPAYICDVFFPILKKYHIKPIFLDIDLKTFNIKPEEIAKKITPQLKSILVCHTYGLPVDLEKLLRSIGTSDVPRDVRRPLIIEDCAHAFGAQIQGKYVGNFGDVSFFSLYKQFPSLRGGLAVFKHQISGRRTSLTLTKFGLRDFVSLLNCFPLFSFLFKKFGSEIAPKMLRKEKLEKPSEINRISLNLFSAFSKDFEKDLEKRIKLGKFFQEELKRLGFETPAPLWRGSLRETERQEPKNNVFCYLSALTPPNLDRDKIVRELRRHKIFATRIWHAPIVLNQNVQKEYNINLGEFKNTVEAAKRIINFPLQNFYAKKDIEKMISAFKEVCRHQMSTNFSTNF